MKIAILVNGNGCIRSNIEYCSGRSVRTKKAKMRTRFGRETDKVYIVLRRAWVRYTSHLHTHGAVFQSKTSGDVLFGSFLDGVGFEQFHLFATTGGDDSRVHQLDNHIAAYWADVKFRFHTFVFLGVILKLPVFRGVTFTDRQHVCCFPAQRYNKKVSSGKVGDTFFR